MSLMGKFTAIMSDTMVTDVNEELFDRRITKQIWEFIADDLKSVEMLPDVHVKNIQYIRDPSKIDVKLNHKVIKNRKILKNKIEKLVPIQQDIYDAIRFDIEIRGGQTITNTILLPKYIDRYHFMIGGNKTLVMFQVVDNATYNRKGDVILKSRIQAKLSKDKAKLLLIDVEGGKSFKTSSLQIDLFRKKFNPLYYFLAKKGMLGTIKFFGYQRFLDIVTEVKDPEHFYYFRVNGNMLLEAEKTLFDNDGFFRTFTGMLSQIFTARMTIEDIYQEEVWLKMLGSLFTTSAKNQINKGADVLRSFKNVLDSATQNTIRQDYRDKADIYCVIRWMMREFNELRNMDNNSLDYKRIRTNEYIAAYFGKFLKDKVNYALNMRRDDKDKLARIFTFDEHILIKALFRGKKACPLFRYNIDINDLQALNGLKYSFTGIQGLPSDKVKDEQRDVYPSHIGKFELNSISASAPGITGMLTPFCKIYDGGYFGEAKTIVKPYEKKLRKNIKAIRDNSELYSVLKQHANLADNVHTKRLSSLRYQDFRNDSGYITLTRPEHERNAFGYITLNSLRLRDEGSFIRNRAGYIELIPVREISIPKRKVTRITLTRIDE